MTYIRIDHAELMAAAQLLNSCATESSQIGTQLASCAHCEMPSEIRGTVDRAVATIDRNLDEIAIALHNIGNDLTRRAVTVAAEEFGAMIAAALVSSGFTFRAPAVIPAAPLTSTARSTLPKDLSKLSDYEKKILSDQIHTDLIMGRKSPLNDALKESTDQMMMSAAVGRLQQGQLNRRPTGIKILEPSDSQVEDRVARELGHRPKVLFDSDRRWHGQTIPFEPVRGYW